MVDYRYRGSYMGTSRRHGTGTPLAPLTVWGSVDEEVGGSPPRAPGQGHAGAAVAVVVHAPDAADLRGFQSHGRPCRTQPGQVGEDFGVGEARLYLHAAAQDLRGGGR